MPPVPIYWYVEAETSGQTFEFPPTRMRGLGPDPFIGDDGSGAVDLYTGEVYREAVLMCALPSPRFRYRGNLREKVILPYRAAVTLEDLQLELQAAGFEDACPEGGHNCLNRGRHYRVEVSDTIRVTLHCNLHWENSLRLACREVNPVGPCSK